MCRITNIGISIVYIKSEGPLNITMLSYLYMDSCYKDNRWSRDNLIFIMGIYIPGKIVFILNQDPIRYWESHLSTGSAVTAAIPVVVGDCQRLRLHSLEFLRSETERDGFLHVDAELGKRKFGRAIVPAFLCILSGWSCLKLFLGYYVFPWQCIFTLTCHVFQLIFPSLSTHICLFLLCVYQRQLCL